MDVYVYPSNIAASIEGEEPGDIILNNIKLPDPKLTIHTGFCFTIISSSLDTSKGPQNGACRIHITGCKKIGKENIKQSPKHSICLRIGN